MASNKLTKLIEQFTNDSWNSINPDGTRRFDKKIQWIESMIKQYADKYNVTTDEMVESFENNRDYSWPNYYQEANFPTLENTKSIIIFETIEDFKKANLMFKCPQCGTISKHPQDCLHRVKKDGECDWCSYGLFKSNSMMVVKNHSLVPIPVFEIAEKEV